MGGLQAEDYKEPRCLSCSDFYQVGKDANVIPVPLDRVMDRLDRYWERNDAEGAAKHLEFWESQAREGRDWRGLLSILNELMGVYRKMSRRDPALRAAREAGALLSDLDMEDSITAGTVFLNMATVFVAFDLVESALPRYRQAQALYERYLEEGDGRLGGLYNNMALAYAIAGDYALARELYGKALAIMAAVPQGQAECAMTYLNLANVVEGEKGLLEGAEEIEQYLALAENSLNAPELQRNGYYAFVCEKCAPTFSYYGWFAQKEELLRRSKEIYERAGTC